MPGHRDSITSASDWVGCLMGSHVVIDARVKCGACAKIVVALLTTALLAEASLAFEVTWNGVPLSVHPARVSAVPMNQVWTGYQRPVEQTAAASFVSFDMSSPGDLAIAPDDAERKGDPVILPLSYAPQIRREGGTYVLRVEEPRQFVIFFGKGAPPLHVFANSTFDAPRGGDEIVFGPGEHHVGALFLKSGQTIRIEEGAVVYGAIFVAHARDVKIAGRGIVDGSYLDRADSNSTVYKRAVAAGLVDGPYGAAMAVTTFSCAWATNVLVEGVTFRNPPRWTMIVRAHSKDVTIDNVKIIGCWRYNSDGINVCSSEDVSIRNSFIRAFDDCIVARGAYLDGDEGPTRNILVENCVLWCDWGKNCEVWAGDKPCLIENVKFRGIVCAQVGTTIACDVTTWYGSSDTRIRNVVFEDIELDFAYPRMSEHYQRSPTDVKYRGGEMRSCSAFVVNSEKFGRNLGNQKFSPTEDLSGFHARYEDIAFRRMRILGDAPPDIKGRIDASPASLTIDGVTLDDMPKEMKVEVLGDAVVR